MRHLHFYRCTLQFHVVFDDHFQTVSPHFSSLPIALVNDLFDTLWQNIQWTYDGDVPPEYLFPENIDFPTHEMEPDDQLATDTLDHLDYYLPDLSGPKPNLSTQHQLSPVNVVTVPMVQTDNTSVAPLPLDQPNHIRVANLPPEQNDNPRVAILPLTPTQNPNTIPLPLDQNHNPGVAALPLDQMEHTRVALLPPAQSHCPGVAAPNCANDLITHPVTQTQPLTQSQPQDNHDTVLDNTPLCSLPTSTPHTLHPTQITPSLKCKHMPKHKTSVNQSNQQTKCLIHQQLIPSFKEVVSAYHNEQSFMNYLSTQDIDATVDIWLTDQVMASTDGNSSDPTSSMLG